MRRNKTRQGRSRGLRTKKKKCGMVYMCVCEYTLKLTIVKGETGPRHTSDTKTPKHQPYVRPSRYQAPSTQHQADTSKTHQTPSTKHTRRQTPNATRLYITIFAVINFREGGKGRCLELEGFGFEIHADRIQTGPGFRVSYYRPRPPSPAKQRTCTTEGKGGGGREERRPRIGWQ